MEEGYGVLENNLDALESGDDWLNPSPKTTPRATTSQSNSVRSLAKKDDDELVL